jgi:hypothetical protein
LERQRIRDQIGALEEQLELLDHCSQKSSLGSLQGSRDPFFDEEKLLSEAKRSVAELKELFREQSLQKSVPAQDFLKRVTSILIREASAAGYKHLSVGTFGTGRISLDMVEASMSAILACLRLSLSGFSGMDLGRRAKLRLFPSYSFYLEAHGGSDEVRFILMDDGQGKPQGGAREGFQQKIRALISRQGGWFRRRALARYGGQVELRIPLASPRFDCLVLQSGKTEVLLRASCVAEILEDGGRAQRKQDGRFVACLDETHGLAPAEEAEGSSAPPVAVRVAVADFEFWIRCDSIKARVKSRKHPSDGFVDHGSWITSFGIFQTNGANGLLPLLEGENLMRFFLENRRENESD